MDCALASRSTESGGEALQQVQLVRPQQSLGTMVDIQLAIGVREVALDGGHAVHQVVGDLLVAHARREETHDLDVPRRQRLRESRRGSRTRQSGWRPVERLKQAPSAAAVRTVNY